MSELKDRLRSDLTTAIRGRDEVSTATLRMALAAITTEEVAGGTSAWKAIGSARSVHRSSAPSTANL